MLAKNWNGDSSWTANKQKRSKEGNEYPKSKQKNKVHIHCVSVVAGLFLLPVERSLFSRGRSGKTANDADPKRLQHGSSLLQKCWGFYAVREIKLQQEHFWLVLLKLAVAAGMLLFGAILLIHCEFAHACLSLLYCPASFFDILSLFTYLFVCLPNILSLNRLLFVPHLSFLFICQFLYLAASNFGAFEALINI